MSDLAPGTMVSARAMLIEPMFEGERSVDNDMTVVANLMIPKFDLLCFAPMVGWCLPFFLGEEGSLRPWTHVSINIMHDRPHTFFTHVVRETVKR